MCTCVCTCVLRRGCCAVRPQPLLPWPRWSTVLRPDPLVQTLKPQNGHVLSAPLLCPWDRVYRLRWGHRGGQVPVLDKPWGPGRGAKSHLSQGRSGEAARRRRDTVLLRRHLLVSRRQQEGPSGGETRSPRAQPEGREEPLSRAAGRNVSSRASRPPSLLAVLGRGGGGPGASVCAPQRSRHNHLFIGFLPRASPLAECLFC